MKTSWFIAAMVVAVAVGEAVGWVVAQVYDVRMPPAVVAAFSVGMMAVVISQIYDGSD